MSTTENNGQNELVNKTKDILNNAAENVVAMDRMQKALLTAAIAEVFWILAWLSFIPGIIRDISVVVAFVVTIVAYVLGGGILCGFFFLLGVAKSIMSVVLLCGPFPINLFIALAVGALIVGLFPIILIVAPLPIIFIKMRQS